MSDLKKVSNEDHEIVTVMEKLRVDRHTVHYAKYVTGSNDREVIEKWLIENKGKKISFIA
jgi:hypothetical protein